MGIVVKARKDGLEIGNANMLRKHFAKHGTKIRGQSEVAPFVRLVIRKPTLKARVLRLTSGLPTIQTLLCSITRRAQRMGFRNRQS